MDRAALAKVLHDQHDEFQRTKVEVQRFVDLEPHFKSLKHVSVITGVRRCGKSTLLKQICSRLPSAANIFYLRLDDPRLSTFLESDFETAYAIWLEEIRSSADQPSYLFFDEVQNVDSWERWIDYFSLRPNTKVFVTGSNSKLLSSEFSTFLTGRQLRLHLTPFSMNEILHLHFADPQSITQMRSSPEGQAEFQKLFTQFNLFGGFPRAYLDRNAAILPDLYDDILRRDILPRSKRARPRSLIELARILATESGRLFNRSNVAPIINVSGPLTVGKYCQLFCDAFLFQEIRAFSPSLRKQLRSLSKFYCIDHALSREVGLGFASGDSAQLEIMVFNELSRQRNSIFYWNSNKGYEVDFLVVQGGKPVTAIQVAYSVDNSSTREREVRALLAAKKELGIQHLIIITNSTTQELEIDATRIKVVPFLEWASGKTPGTKTPSTV